MQLWIASFVILFALSQLLDWLRGVEFSLPVLALGGLCLAIASNYDKRHCFPFWPAPSPGATAAAIAPQAAPDIAPAPLNEIAITPTAAPSPALPQPLNEVT